VAYRLRLVDDERCCRFGLPSGQPRRLFPSCGFSNTAVRILSDLRVEFETVDVLADERVR
jgi:glutaredoxin